MKMRRRSSPIAAVAMATFLVAGCSDSATEPENNNLTQEEAIAVFGEIVGALFEAAGGAMANDGGQFSAALMRDPASAMVVDIDLDESVPCTNGGTIRVNGSIEMDVDENEDGTYTYTFVQTPENCVVTTEQGSSFRVSGQPSIQMSGSFTILDDEPVGLFEMAFAGGLRWNAMNGGDNGSCTVDLDYGFNMATLKGTAEGRICGYDIDEQF